MISVVIDTNVIYSALRSKQGASFKLISLIDTNKFTMNISVPLILEYEDVLKRGKIDHLTDSDIDSFIDYICFIAKKNKIFYLWRPQLKDPKDDSIFELAVTGKSRYIVTYNLNDFNIPEYFQITAITPQMFLKKIGE